MFVFPLAFLVIGAFGYRIVSYLLVWMCAREGLTRHTTLNAPAMVVLAAYWVLVPAKTCADAQSRNGRTRIARLKVHSIRRGQVCEVRLVFQYNHVVDDLGVGRWVDFSGVGGIRWHGGREGHDGHNHEGKGELHADVLVDAV